MFSWRKIKQNKIIQKILDGRLSTARVITGAFALVILLGSLLLSMPFATAPGQHTNYIDALFTSTSAVCVTGLVTVTTAVQWSFIGKIIILLLAQLGGLGVTTVVLFFCVLVGKKITLKQRMIIQESYNLDTMAGLVKLIKQIVKGTLVIEGIGVILFSFQFIPEFGPLKGIGFSVFHSVSAFCNAGLDILGEASFFQYRFNPLVNFTTMFLIIISGLGFPVWWDIVRVMRKVKKGEVPKKHFFEKLELHSKFVLSITGILLVGGALLILIFEWNNPATLKEMNVFQKLMAAMFQSTTLRTAGFFTIPQEGFTTATVLLSCVFMFIGGSPAGTAGGMKTTTIGMLFMTVISTLRGKKDTEIFERRISEQNIRTGLTIVLLGISVLIGSTMLLSAVEGAPLADVLFESASALGTVGLTRGLTPHLSLLGKIIIIVTMYTGRIGPITLVMTFGVHKKKSGSATLPERRIIVG